MIPKADGDDPRSSAQASFVGTQSGETYLSAFKVRFATASTGVSVGWSQFQPWALGSPTAINTQRGHLFLNGSTVGSEANDLLFQTYVQPE